MVLLVLEVDVVDDGVEVVVVDRLVDDVVDVVVVDRVVDELEVDGVVPIVASSSVSATEDVPHADASTAEIVAITAHGTAQGTRIPSGSHPMTAHRWHPHHEIVVL